MDSQDIRQASSIKSRKRTPAEMGQERWLSGIPGKERKTWNGYERDWNARIEVEEFAPDVPEFCSTEFITMRRITYTLALEQPQFEGKGVVFSSMGLLQR